MKRTVLAAAICLAMLLTLTAAAENTVEVLPTSAPMPDPVTEVNEYAFPDMDPYYADEDPEDHQMPAFTAGERNRLADAQARWDAGERPESSILDVTEQVHISLIRLPAGQYEGQSWFLLLPFHELTDGELLQIVDAFSRLGIRFDPDMLSWRNCMRGGGVECLRSYQGDEPERARAIAELYRRAGLRPETPFTASVLDDGIGEATLDEEDYCGLEGFSFRPARRMTDEELLQICAYGTPEPAASPDELSKYEFRLRQVLHARLGMPLATVRTGGEFVDTEGSSSEYGDTRPVYVAFFEEAGGSGCTWNGALAIETGELVWADITLDSRFTGDDEQISDIVKDPWDPHWAEIAEKTVASMTENSGAGIESVQATCATGVNSTLFARVRVTLTDGAVCQVYVSFLTERVLLIEYNDAENFALRDYFYTYTMLEEGNINE